MAGVPWSSGSTRSGTVRRARARHDAAHASARRGAERNQLSKSFKSLGSQEERDALSRKVKDLKAELGEVEGRASEAEARLHQKALLIPNSTHPDVPVGPEDCANVVSVRGPKPQFAFPPRDHVTLGARSDRVSPRPAPPCTPDGDSLHPAGPGDAAEALDIVDFESGSRVSGSKFAYLTNEGALLEFALAQWAMSRAAARGFKLVISACPQAPQRTRAHLPLPQRPTLPTSAWWRRAGSSRARRPPRCTH